jgi:HK97 family phage major capsid protein
MQITHELEQNIRSIEALVSTGNKRDIERAGVLLGLMKLKSRSGEDEKRADLRKKHSELFRSYLATRPEGMYFARGSNNVVGIDETEKEYEQRATSLLGRPISQTYSGSSGAQGGTFVPEEFSEKFFLGLAQYSDLMNPDNVNLEKSVDYRYPGSNAAGWDLSTFAAVRVGAPTGFGDGVQQTAQTVPVSDTEFLTGYIYKCTLLATMELFQDDPLLLDRIAKAFAIGFARGVGTDLTVGSGINEIPQGLLTGAVNCGYTVGTGSGTGYSSPAVSNSDLLDVYFSVNRVYRQSPKCAWVMSDESYQRIRTATDNAGRPLIDVIGDQELLYGKKILIAPDMPSSGGSPYASTGKIVFGDLEHFWVKASQMVVAKNLQVGGVVESGQYAVIGRMRVNSTVFDPTGGNVPPIVYANMT